MSKHTPGPWAVEKESESHSIVNRSFDGDEWCVAEVHKQTDVAIANANLIAAAPDLLEALEHVEAMLTNDSSEDIDYRKVVKAIAKARGEA